MRRISSVALIANPAAFRTTKAKLDRAIRFLRNRQIDPRILLTTKRGDAEIFAADAASGETPLIIVAGGDGTINEVVNGIAGKETPLAILPMGTENVLAKELEIPEELEGALEKAVSLAPKKVSLGLIELEKDCLRRYFFLMAGIGFDGSTVYGLNSSLKKLTGKAAYFISGFLQLISYNPQELSFVVDGSEHHGSGAVIGKSRRYGGGVIITPGADLRSPELQVCVFRGGSRRDLLRYTAMILRGTHVFQKDVIMKKAGEVRIRGRAKVQVDGDYLGETPALVTVKKDVLQLVC